MVGWVLYVSFVGAAAQFWCAELAFLANRERKTHTAVTARVHTVATHTA